MTKPSPDLITPAIQRVSNIELFFDLVFVFAITQLTGVIASAHSPGDYIRATLVLMTLMWMYSGYAWLTSNIVITGFKARQLLFIAMAGFFVMALGIPTVFTTGGLPYALGLLAVIAIHAYLFSTAPTESGRAIWEIAPYNLALGLFVLAAGFVEPPWDWPFWTAAVGVIVLATARRQESHFQLSPAHFVERNGLLVLIALGESVVGIGVGAHGLPIDLPLALTVALALLHCASVWWTYFDGDDRIAERQFTLAGAEERARMALMGFGLAHVVMIAGIILLAAGLKLAIQHPTGAADRFGLWNVDVGLAIYLIGDAFYRRVLRIGPPASRLVVAAMLFLTVPLGLGFGAPAQIAGCLLLLQSIWVVERKKRGIG